MDAVLNTYREWALYGRSTWQSSQIRRWKSPLMKHREKTSLLKDRGFLYSCRAGCPPIASAAAAFCSIALFINGTLELTYCLIILVSAFMVYSQLESAGEMFFMLSMIDASIDRVEEINQSPQIDIDGKEQTQTGWILKCRM